MDTISSPCNVSLVESKYVASQQKGYLTYDLSQCAHWQFDIDRASRDVVSFKKLSTLHYLYLNFILFGTLLRRWSGCFATHHMKYILGLFLRSRVNASNFMLMIWQAIHLKFGHVALDVEYLQQVTTYKVHLDREKEIIIVPNPIICQPSFDFHDNLPFV